MNLKAATPIFAWQQSVWDMLTQRFPELGHGLLFYGKDGCGKEIFVQQFLEWVLCSHKTAHGACGHCGSCVWLKSDTHPNYVRISTEDDSKKAHPRIKIEQIRELLPFVQQTVDGWRVIVIEPAEALNVAAANALLKTLEEPGERVLIILVTTHFLKLPATIRSRLQRYALDRLSTEQAVEYVQRELPELDQQKIQLLLNLSNAMPLQALKLNDQNWLDKRLELILDWQDLVQNKRLPISYATKWTKALSFHDFMQMFEYLLSDIICVKLKQPVKNIDLDFQKLAQAYSLETLFQILEHLQRSKTMLEQNVQTQLIVDQLFVQLMNI
ncbi:DNA polymerase III subunit delta' [Acinetobacter sp. MD2(2019)]|uniref:DNA polymerase III subunit delta' n=1 Tax=Acinetobacter sp. MD2(2019) TaxID=2605273 RepID=UPI002D1F4E23|nr:DNA polymerase III subunit delta' [Acinetobacter sp. MD2(2019)]MEB3752833.1 DNA polymerase III subunit delta' [Acinetobacter sp. MD2(2019)]